MKERRHVKRKEKIPNVFYSFPFTEHSLCVEPHSILGALAVSCVANDGCA